MEKLSFTKEEQKYIDETLNIVLDDIDELYKLSQQKNIFIKFWLEGGKEYMLSINDRYIALINLDRSPSSKWEKSFASYNANLSYPGNYQLQETIYYKKGIKRETVKYMDRLKIKDEEANDIIRFLAKYDSIRTKIIAELQASHSEKETLLDALHKLRTKYSGEVYVDFGLSRSQNIQTLEVTEENGKTVGTIDFGSRIVKIITEGDIVLKKIERAKDKVKQKV